MAAAWTPCGVHEHFSTNFAGEINRSTHYIVLAYEAERALDPASLPHAQHRGYRWLSPAAIVADPDVHPHPGLLQGVRAMTNPLPYRAVILCGGSGSRLWPLSRELLPKQFIRLTDDRSLLQNTLLRLDSAGAQAHPTLVCNEAHRYIAAEQAQELGIKDAELILEPHARNTAPAIAAATLRAMRGGEDPVMLIMPSDHVLEDGEVLATAYAQAYLAARQGALVTFGITRPRRSAAMVIQADAPAAMAPARRVRRFVEKPSPEVAQRFIEEGNYYWNSGMFAFQASVFLAEMDRLAPRMLQQVRAAIAAGHGDDALFQLDGPAFEACPSDSMDYAIMERTDSAVVIRWPRPGATWAPGTRSGASPPNRWRATRPPAT